MTNRNSYSRWLPIAVGLLTVALWVAWGWYVEHRFPDNVRLSPEAQQVFAARGQFGEIFGGINALFTALILAGAIYTVWLQHQGLEALKEQQNDSRKDNARTALLLAYTAIINAKSAQLNARYRIAMDFATAIKGVDPHSEESATGFLLIQSNAQAAAAAMTDLESVANDLSTLIAEMRETKTGNGA